MTRRYDLELEVLRRSVAKFANELTHGCDGECLITLDGCERTMEACGRELADIAASDLRKAAELLKTKTKHNTKNWSGKRLRLAYLERTQKDGCELKIALEYPFSLEQYKLCATNRVTEGLWFTSGKSGHSAKCALGSCVSRSVCNCAMEGK